jgi:2-C-methyl-D-erythritol 4-phosphate cytidylyltransferase
MNQGQIEGLSIIIPAAGQSLRMGLGPKALLQLDGRSLLQRVSEKALALAAEVIVAAPPGCEAQWALHCPGCRVIGGGEIHLRSVAALMLVATLPLVLIMSVAAPLMSPELVRRVAQAAKLNGIASAYLPSDMPMVRLEDGMITAMIPRHETGMMQAPTAFQRTHFLALLACADDADWQRQAWVEIAMHHHYAIAAVPGEKGNTKLTTIEDWHLAQQSWRQNQTGPG